MVIVRNRMVRPMKWYLVKSNKSLVQNYSSVANANTQLIKVTGWSVMRLITKTKNHTNAQSVQTNILQKRVSNDICVMCINRLTISIMISINVQSFDVFFTISWCFWKWMSNHSSLPVNRWLPTTNLNEIKWMENNSKFLIFIDTLMYIVYYYVEKKTMPSYNNRQTTYTKKSGSLLKCMVLDL